MEAVGFEGANRVFQAPEGMSQEECRDLPCFYDGMQTISVMRFTPAELKRVSETGVLWVRHMGNFLQPHAIGVEPMIQFEDGHVPFVEPIMPQAPRSKG